MIISFHISVFSGSLFYSPTKADGYSFGLDHKFCPSIDTFCLSGIISPHLFIRFDAFFVYMINTMDSISYKFRQNIPLNTLVIALYPGIQLRLPCTPGQFFMGANCSLRPPECETKVSSKKKLVWAM